jgi:hypothetical protein
VCQLSGAAVLSHHEGGAALRDAQVCAARERLARRGGASHPLLHEGSDHHPTVRMRSHGARDVLRPIWSAAAAQIFIPLEPEELVALPETGVIKAPWNPNCWQSLVNRKHGASTMTPDVLTGKYTSQLK